MNDVTLRDLAKELLQTLTDYERRFFYTFKMLFTNPYQVLLDYNNDRRHLHFPVFRYLMISLIIGNVIIYFFLDENAVYFQENLASTKEMIKSMMAAKGNLDKYNDAEFTAVYMGQIRMVLDMWKAFAVLYIPALMITSYFALGKLKLNFASSLLINTYIAAQFYFLSVFSTPFMQNSSNSYFYWGILIFLISYFYKKLAEKAYKRPWVRGVAAGAGSCALFYGSCAVFGFAYGFTKSKLGF